MTLSVSGPVTPRRQRSNRRILAHVDPDSDALGAAWRRAQARLPDGWTLDSLRCASSGLSPEERSDDWIAVAVSGHGEERRHRAHDAIAALEGLGATFSARGIPGHGG